MTYCSQSLAVKEKMMKTRINSLLGAKRLANFTLYLRKF